MTPDAAAADHGYRAAAVVLAAGGGSRMGAAQNKVFLHLCGRRIVSWSVHALARVGAVSRIVLVIREQDRALAQETVDREMDGLPVEIVTGGQSRRESEMCALRHLAPEIASGDLDLVLIHDGARPLLTPTLISAVADAAFVHGASYPALVADDIRRVRPDGSLDMLNAELMLRAQTPQAFRARALLAAYERADADEFEGSDTVSCWERYCRPSAHWVPGDPRNIKITYPQDLLEAEETLRRARFSLN